MDNGFMDLPNGGEFLIGMDQTRSADLDYTVPSSISCTSLLRSEATNTSGPAQQAGQARISHTLIILRSLSTLNFVVYLLDYVFKLETILY